ncbi:MAG: SUMF1/EgtB/PvdO family nonheme iron enzyme [Myxococcota bacterium]
MTRDAGWHALLAPLALVDAPPRAERWQCERATVGGRVDVEVAGADLSAWLAETRTLARLQHPAIPPLHEVGVLPDGRIARIRAAVTGARWAEAAPTREERPRADALIRAAEALAHAHARGVPHGRFGEEALVLGEGGQVWVVGWSATAAAPADGPVGGRDVAAMLSLVDAWLVPTALGDADVRRTLTTASAIAARLRAWLDGADRRARALGWVARADAVFAEAAAAAHAHAHAARVGRVAVAAVRTWEPEETRLPAWALEDAAEALRRTSRDRVAAGQRALHAALEQDPTLPEAHATMARIWSVLAAEAHRAGAPAAEARAELALREHVHRLAPSHPLRAHGDRFLRGTGALTLVTDPPGALVRVERYEEVDHRLVLRDAGTLGHTPLHAVELAPGSYRLRIETQGRVPALYPVLIERQQHWDGVPPGGTAPLPIRLLHTDALGPDDRYVPAGWFAAGARESNAGVWPRPLWCDGFVIRRFPVTAGELAEWLDALLDAGEEGRALAHSPRSAGLVGAGPHVYPRGTDGRFRPALPPAEADRPALHVSFATASAYANARRAEDGLRWRLPMDLEWEKAARGVDGRAFPWGRRRTTRWANLEMDGRAAAPASVDSFPLDESPYGVRGVSGNAADWVADPFELLGPELPDHRVAVVDPTPDHASAVFGICRGAAFSGRDPHVASREQPNTARSRLDLGFRLARSLT